MCNFFFCHYDFKKLSAAEASESVYMRERVNTCIQQCLYIADIFENIWAKIWKISINETIIILKGVEHIVANEIAHHEQFLLFTQCFHKSSTMNALICICTWEIVNVIVCKTLQR